MNTLKRIFKAADWIEKLLFVISGIILLIDFIQLVTFPTIKEIVQMVATLGIASGFMVLVWRRITSADRRTNKGIIMIIVTLVVIEIVAGIFL
jgi:cytochrome c oxidase subunit IV